MPDSALRDVADRLPPGTLDVAFDDDDAIVGGLTIRSALQEAKDYEQRGDRERAGEIRIAVARRDYDTLREIFEGGFLGDDRLAPRGDDYADAARTVWVAPNTSLPACARPRPVSRAVRSRPRERRATTRRATRAGPGGDDRPRREPEPDLAPRTPSVAA